MAKSKQTVNVIDKFTGPYEFLSNFQIGAFYMPRFVTMVPTAEHGFQMLKCQKMSDIEKILDEATPGGAKRIGRKVEMVDGWETGFRVNAMQYVLACKFNNMRRIGDRRSMTLGQRLMSTGDLPLIEGNRHHDNFWGDCRCGKKPECATPGRNMLGELLMARRAELIENSP